MSDPIRPSLPIDLLRSLLEKLRLTRPRPPRDVGADRLRAQVRVIRDAMKESGVSGAPVEGSQPPRDDADIHYLYRPGHALVRRHDLGRLEEYFGTDENRERFRGDLESRETRIPGLMLAALPSRVDGQDDVLATLAELERSHVVEPGAITPDHVVYVTPRGFMCPATEPETPHRHTKPWPPALPSSRELADRDRVRVAVVDTGLWTEAVGSAMSPWLEVGDVVADPSDVETVDPTAIHPYAGHGTFVAGVISCLAPDTRVEVEGVLVHGGAVYESEIIQQLQEAIDDDDHPQVISISAGTHTRGDFALLGFELLGESNKLAEREDVLIVAAAGNDSSDKPFWPAAFPWVVSVGSVDPDACVSDFSNVGPWVDVYARGRDLVNAFPKGSYTCHEPPNVGEVRTFDGLARWSGTSFSTPVVTGLIAARMRETGQSAREAWRDVLATAAPHTDPRGGAIKVVGPLT
ncbi:S8 family peptidase [Nocardioides daeguensis]|uniref:S8/S53 family peptidase n=1 Tax=Nocardioides daeguensis TaxID=908359 RepID=A0ABP6VGN4_9ACTN|nr:S8/S53 family peptidase [Nocardioides daeguensis]MBV6728873.1 S8/S53 family peptidase [Nocardioides daeguensis]MCR1773394.1 S8/S53 family peptidase [Nocardioides daeguensis]